MAVFNFDAFNGEKPLFAKNLLEPNDAAIAHNVLIQGGILEGLPGVSPITGGALPSVLFTPKTIYKYRDAWLTFSTDADVHTTLAPNDITDKRVWTTDGSAPPQVAEYAQLLSGAGRFPGDSYDLGVPAPAAAMSVSVSGVAQANTLAETRFYVATFVNSFGQEGPPGNVSAELEVSPGQTANYTTPAAPGGNRAITSCRIYRTATGSSGTEFLFVGQRSLSTAYADGVLTENLGEVLPTEDFDPPPTNLQGLTAIPNGFFAGFYDNVLCFSVPGFYYAWPPKYQLKTDTPIVAVAPLGGSNILVVTESFPYLVSGSTPDNMGMEKLEDLQACVSKRAVVDIGESVIYPSPNGLIQVSLSGTRHITEGIFTRRQWAELIAYPMFAAHWNGTYVCFFTKPTGVEGFVINPRFPEIGKADITGIEATAFYNEDSTGLLYLSVMEGAVPTVYEFGEGAVMTGEWESKEFELKKLFTPAVARIYAEAYPVNVEAVIDGVVVAKTITSNLPEYLPGAPAGSLFQMRLPNVTTGVRQVTIADSMNALMEQP